MPKLTVVNPPQPITNGRETVQIIKVRTWRTYTTYQLVGGSLKTPRWFSGKFLAYKGFKVPEKI